MARTKRTTETTKTQAEAEAAPAPKPEYAEDDESDEAIAARDEAEIAAIEEEEKPRGTVVADKYRKEYAARGHPNHCGDALAKALNDRVQTKQGKLDVPAMVAICEANGVNPAKWLKDTPGWQGRFRMSARNAIAKAVKETGVLKTPNGEVKLATYQ